MKTSILCFALYLICHVAASAAVPVNDLITKATLLTSSYSVRIGQDLTSATASPMDPLINGFSAGKTVWFLFPKVVSSGLLEVTIHSTSAVGHAALFQIADPENPAGSLQWLSQMALAPGGTVTLSKTAIGRPIMVMVAGSGLFDITHRFSSAGASNDFPINAEVITGVRGTVLGDNTVATQSADEPKMSLGTPALMNTVWYRWTPSFTDNAFVDTNFSYTSADPIQDPTDASGVHDTVIAVFRSPSTGASRLETVVSDDNGGWNLNSRAGFFAVAGTTYYIAVATKSGRFPGAFHLQYYRGGSAGEIYLGQGVSKALGTCEESLAVLGITVRRRYVGVGAATCLVKNIAGGNALPGINYGPFSKTIDFYDYSSTEDRVFETAFGVNLIDDANPNTNRTFNVQLTNPSAGATLDLSDGFVTIVDDDEEPEAGLFLPVDQVRVSERSGWVKMLVQRIGGEASYEQLLQAQVGGTASNVVDFSLAQGGSVAAGVKSAFCEFYINDDHVFEADETFTVEVNGGRGSYQVTIEDDDRYVPVAGVLTAALDYADTARQAVLCATITNLGAITGKLMIVGQTLPFAGKLDTRGKVDIAIAPVGRPIFYLNLSAQDAEGRFKVDLIDAATQNVSTAQSLVQNFTATSNPFPLAGAYTANGISLTDFNLPVLTAAALKVSSAGIVIVAGRLFDGTAYTASGFVDGESNVSAMASLYSAQGCVGFYGRLPDVANQVDTLGIKINRPARANDPAKLGCVLLSMDGSISKYTPPLKGKRAMEVWQAGAGKAILNGGALPLGLIKNFTISTTNVITLPVDAAKLKLTVLSADGVFAGTFVLPGTTKTLTLFGSLTQLPGLNGIGTGFFFDGLKGGVVVLQ